VADQLHCPVCRRVSPANVPPGFCPVCEFMAALKQSENQASRVLEPSAAQAIGLEPSVPDSMVDSSPLNTPFLHPSHFKNPIYFGDYELLEEIASGGMGTVFRARQMSLNRLVAIKLISVGAMASSDMVKRFKIEAETAAGLSHPNIVPIHEIGEQSGQHFFSMKLIEGPTLKQALGRKPMDVRQAAQLLAAVSRAVHFAHQRGVLHRDLKPSNMLLDDTGAPHLTDFGLAKLIEQDSVLTRTNEVMGTPAYMSPEQARGDTKAVTTAADVYGLGAVLYETLTGKPPFAGGTSVETIRQVLDEEPVPPSLFNRGVNRDLETICLKCLEKAPSRRYGSAQEVADELDRFLADAPIQARPVSAPKKLWRWCRRNSALSGSLALILLLLLVVAIGSPIALLRISRAQRDSEENLYVANIHLANEALEAHDLFKAQSYLERIESSPRQSMLRGWEWRYLKTRCRGDYLMILGRHESWISAIAGSSDGRWLATIDEDGLVKVWDWTTHREVAAWPAHPTTPRLRPPNHRLHALVFTPDSETLITTGQDRTVRFWRAGSWQATSILQGLTNSVQRLAISPDGGSLATGDLRGQVCLWNLRSDPPAILARENTRLRVLFSALAFAPDGNHLLAGAAEQPVVQLDISDPRDIREAAVLEDSAIPLVTSPDGRWLATVGTDRHLIRLWEFPGPNAGRTMKVQGDIVGALAFSPDGKTLASGQHDGQITLWNLPDYPKSVRLLGHQTMVTGLAFSTDGRALASTSYDKTVRLWDTARDDLGGTVFSHGGRVRAVAFSPDSRRVASMANEPANASDPSARLRFSLRIWQVQGGGAFIGVTNASAPFGGNVAFSPDGNEVAVDDHENVHFYRASSLEPVYRTHKTHAIYLPDGSGGFYRYGRQVFRRNLGEVSDTNFIEAPAAVVSLAVSPDSRTLACGLADGDIHFADARDRKVLAKLSGHEDWVTSLAFSPDGRTLASASWDRHLGLWDVTSGQIKTMVPAHQGGISMVSFSPDGGTIATCGEDGTVRLWNPRRLEEAAVLHGHSTAVNGVAFSPDGQWLASASDDGTVRLWRALPREEIEKDGRPGVTEP
jgi:WD40 repeat protein/serine/threonine protein kinase